MSNDKISVNIPPVEPGVRAADDTFVLRRTPSSHKAAFSAILNNTLGRLNRSSSIPTSEVVKKSKSADDLLDHSVVRVDDDHDSSVHLPPPRAYVKTHSIDSADLTREAIEASSSIKDCKEQLSARKPAPPLKPRRKFFFSKSSGDIDRSSKNEESKSSPESGHEIRVIEETKSVDESSAATQIATGSTASIETVLAAESSNEAPSASEPTAEAPKTEPAASAAAEASKQHYSSIRSLRKKGRSISNRLVGLFSSAENATVAAVASETTAPVVRYTTETVNVTLEVPSTPRHLSVPTIEVEPSKESPEVEPVAKEASNKQHQRQNSLNTSAPNSAAAPPSSALASLFHHLPGSVFFPSTTQVAAESLNEPAKLLLTVAAPNPPKLSLPSPSSPTPTISNHERLERLYGADLLPILVCDHTKSIPLPHRSKESSVKTLAASTVMNLVSNSSPDGPGAQRSSSSKTPEEIETMKRQKADEYFRIEEKQSKLCKALAQEVYRKLDEENAKQHFCEPDEMQKIFYAVIELEKLSSLVHEQIANEIKTRLENSWESEPYFGDILVKFYHFYKTYKPILERFPTCQLTLANCTKRKPFQANLQKILDAAMSQFDNVNRLDMLLSCLVDLPRRCIQLLVSYQKILEVSSAEYANITKVLTALNEIQESSNEALNKMSNFQECYNLQYMIEPMIAIVDNNRLLIKQGPLNKVAKRNGEHLFRHFALFTDMLLVCKFDKIRKKLILNYRINSNEMRLIRDSSETNELTFRVISKDQNNEYMANNPKDKEDWMKAFERVKDLVIDEKMDKRDSSEIDSMLKIGVVPPIWIKDNEQNTCSGCKEVFTTFKRRHHCRTCGRLYCSTCCSLYIPVRFDNFKERQRVCKNCYHILEPVYQLHLASSLPGGGVVVAEEVNGNGTNENRSTSRLQNSISQLHISETARQNLGNIINASKSMNSSSSSSNPNQSLNGTGTAGNNSMSMKNELFDSSMNSSSNEGLSLEETSSSTTTSLSEQYEKILRRRKRPEDEDEEEERASSPLTEEQMKVAQRFFDASNDDDETSETSEDDEEFASAHSSSGHAADLIDLVDLIDLNANRQEGDSNTLKREQHQPTPVEAAEEEEEVRPVPAPRRRSKLKNAVAEQIAELNSQHHQSTPTQAKSPSQTLLRPTKRLSYTGTLKKNSLQHSSAAECEAVESEYGYFCKLPINSDGEVSESLIKWDRQHFTLFSDSTIGVCSNHNNASNPQLIINLGLFKLKNINDTTFGLIKAETKSPHDSMVDEASESVAGDSTADSVKPTTTTTVKRLANKLRMFEFNYEIKFSSKSSKNVWFEALKPRMPLF